VKDYRKRITEVEGVLRDEQEEDEDKREELEHLRDTLKSELAQLNLRLKFAKNDLQTL